MEVFKYKQGDTYPPLSITLTRKDGTNPNLTNATVRLNVVSVDTNTLFLTTYVTIENAVRGQIKYDWKTDDLYKDGRFFCEFEVTYANGNVETFPNDSYIKLRVAPDLNYRVSPSSNTEIAIELKTAIHASEIATAASNQAIAANSSAALFAANSASSASSAASSASSAASSASSAASSASSAASSAASAASSASSAANIVSSASIGRLLGIDTFATVADLTAEIATNGAEYPLGSQLISGVTIYEKTASGWIQQITVDDLQAQIAQKLADADNVVDNTRLANMPAATIKGNNGIIEADPIDLTVDQTNKLLGWGYSGSYTNGGVDMPSSSTEVNAPTGLRCGSVVTSANGFTSVVFSTPLGSGPIVVVTPVWGNSSDDISAKIINRSVNGFDVQVTKNTAGVVTVISTTVCYIAIGKGA